MTTSNAQPSSSRFTLDHLPTEGPSASQQQKQKKQLEVDRYLAGQSVNKAGLTRDEGEVNRIISEASKGSKYHVHQMKKNEELEERIRKLLAIKDEVLKTADISRLEKVADDMITELEASRDLTQTIIHCDMDAFYANVEVKRDPTLKDKAFGVGGGVLTTASYEARKFGCRSGMAGHVAKALCPHLIFVPCNFPLYTEASREVQKVLIQYDENMAMAGMDEGYLNITGYMRDKGMGAEEVVTQLRAEVEKETGLTISVGIAANTMLAKICSDRNKPNGHYLLPSLSSSIRSFMRDLPIRRIPGIGRVAERVLQRMGVETCGDIWKERGVVCAMDHWLGLKGLLKAYLGLGNNVVEPGKRGERKSVGCERTFREKKDDEDILQTLEEIADELEKDLENARFSGRTITVKYKLHSYEVFTRARTIGKYVKTAEEILPIARELLVKELPLHLRLLGIRMTNLKDLDAPEKGIKKFFNTSPGKGKGSTRKRSLDGTDRKPGPDEIIDFTSLSDSDPEGPDEPHYRLSSEAPPLSHPSGPELDDDGEGFAFIDPPPSSGTTRDGRLICPICDKRLRKGTDNEGLNRHVDECLAGNGTLGEGSDEDTGVEIVGGGGGGKVKREGEERGKGSKKRKLEMGDAPSQGKAARDVKEKGKKAGKGKVKKPKNAFDMMMKSR